MSHLASPSAAFGDDGQHAAQSPVVAPHPITLEIESYERKTGFLLLSDFSAEPPSLHIYTITATEKRKEEPQQSIANCLIYARPNFVANLHVFRSKPAAYPVALQISVEALGEGFCHSTRLLARLTNKVPRCQAPSADWLCHHKMARHRKNVTAHSKAEWPLGKTCSRPLSGQLLAFILAEMRQDIG